MSAAPGNTLLQRGERQAIMSAGLGVGRRASQKGTRPRWEGMRSRWRWMASSSRSRASFARASSARSAHDLGNLQPTLRSALCMKLP